MAKKTLSVDISQSTYMYLISSGIDTVSASLFGGSDTGYVDDIVAYANGIEVELSESDKEELSSMIESGLDTVFGEPWYDGENTSDVTGTATVRFSAINSASITFETVEMRPVTTSYMVACAISQED